MKSFNNFVVLLLLCFFARIMPADTMDSRLEEGRLDHNDKSRLGIYAHLSFHDVWQLSRVNHELKTKFGENFLLKVPDYIKLYFHSLSRIQTKDRSYNNYLNVLELAYVSVDYKSGILRWMFDYAINYIKHHFQTPYEVQTSFEKKIRPRFYEWIFIVRSLQSTADDFDTDKFVKEVKLIFTSCNKGAFFPELLSTIEENAVMNVSCDLNPTHIIQQRQKYVINSFKVSEMNINKSKNIFNSLLIFYSQNEIYEYCIKKLYSRHNSGSYRRLSVCFNVLFMRNAADEVVKLINALCSNRRSMEERKLHLWVSSADLFLEIYNKWLRYYEISDPILLQKILEIGLSIDKYLWLKGLKKPQDFGHKNVHCKQERTRRLGS